MLPKLITLDDFFLPTYGTLVAAAFLAALWITVRLSRRAKLSEEVVTNLVIYCALAGLIGAKLTMIAFDFDFYRQNPGAIFSWSTLQAAGVYQGGFVLAIATAVYYMRRFQLPPLATCDVFAPGVALGHAIGRIGCFAAGCCWGVACDRPWAVTFTNPEANRLVGVPLGVPLHPTQLYESAAEAAIFVFLLRRFSRPHRPGEILGLYLALYSTTRFLVEFLRAHDQPLVLGLSYTQWISLAMLAPGAWLLLRKPSSALAPAR